MSQLEKIKSLKEEYEKEIKNRQIFIQDFYSLEEPNKDYYRKRQYDEKRRDKDISSIEIGIFSKVVKNLEELLK